MSFSKAHSAVRRENAIFTAEQIFDSQTRRELCSNSLCRDEAVTGTMQGYSGAKPPRVPGLAAQALPSGKSSPKNTTLFIDLSPRSKSGTNSPRVQGTHNRSNWEENGSVSSRPGSSNGGKKENATDQQKGSEVIVAAVNGSTTESATKTTDAQAISSPMRSRQPASSVFGAQTGGSDLPSDEDGTWSPLRESDDHNAQLQNCYDGLRALEMRCGFINKQLAIKAKHIMLDLSTRLNDASTSRQSGDVRRREIDDEVAVLTSDTPTQSDLEETLQTIRDRIDSKKKVLDGHEDRVKQLDKEKSAAAKKPKKKRQELEASLAQKEDEMMMAKAEAEEAIEQGERELEDFPKTHAEMVKIYSDRIRLLQVGCNMKILDIVTPVICLLDSGFGGDFDIRRWRNVSVYRTTLHCPERKS